MGPIWPSPKKLPAKGTTKERSQFCAFASSLVQRPSGASLMKFHGQTLMSPMGFVKTIFTHFGICLFMLQVVGIFYEYIFKKTSVRLCASISYKYLYRLVSLRILRSLKVLEPESVFAIGPIYLRNHQNGKCKAVLSPVHNEDHLSAAITKNCKNVLSSFPPKESFLSCKIENYIESYWLDYIEGTKKKSSVSTGIGEGTFRKLSGEARNRWGCSFRLFRISGDGHWHPLKSFQY